MPMLLPQSVSLNVAQATATTTSIVPAVSGKRIFVVSAVFNNGGTAQTITLKSHTTTTLTLGGVNAAANGSAVFPYNPDGWMITAPGEALDLTTSGAIANTNVTVNYVQM